MRTAAETRRVRGSAEARLDHRFQPSSFPSAYPTKISQKLSFPRPSFISRPQIFGTQ